MSIITISRGSRSGGQALAEMVAEKLNYDCISREILIEAAEEYGLDERTLIQFIDKPPKFWSRFNINRKMYLHLIKTTLLEHAQKGNLVYHGHSGQFLLKGIKSVLKIRLIASMEYRIKLTMEKEKLNREAAIQYIQRVDDIRNRWAKFFYGVELTDPNLYDLIINIETMTLESACDIICGLTEKPEYQSNLYCLESIKDATLAAKVEAALFADARTKTLDINITSESGNVSLKGSIEVERVRQAVIEVVKSVEGVKSINDEMTIGKLTNIPT
ncbi:MAG: cytidylate kinase family protein [candidate division Zixibacteria bacterium]|nr:cytidylate kinase family protein [Candidatus Tariuqbacter arcticus]